MGQLFFWKKCLKTPWCWKHVETEIVICREMIGLGNLLPEKTNPGWMSWVISDYNVKPSKEAVITWARPSAPKMVGAIGGSRWPGGPKEGSAEPEFCCKKMRVQ